MRLLIITTIVIVALLGGYTVYGLPTPVDETRARAQIAGSTQPEQLPAGTGTVAVRIADGVPAVLGGDAPLIAQMPAALLASPPFSEKIANGWVALPLTPNLSSPDSQTRGPSRADIDESGLVVDRPQLGASPSFVVAAPITHTTPWVAVGVVLGITLASLLGWSLGRMGQSRRTASQRSDPNHHVATFSSRPTSDELTTLTRHVIAVRDLIPQRALAVRLDEGLAAIGYEVMEPDGQRFNPRWHRAVQVRSTDDPTLAGVVAATERVGYVRAGTVDRAADVVVYSTSNGGSVQ